MWGGFGGSSAILNLLSLDLPKGGAVALVLLERAGMFSAIACGTGERVFGIAAILF